MCSITFCESEWCVVTSRSISMVADILTKALGKSQHKKFCKQM
jgi:hypothetical protein